MAGRRSELYRVFHADSQLKSYFLDGVTSTGKTLGTGAYGSVMEVRYKHVVCAAKRIHTALLDPANEGIEEVVQRYRQECLLMGSLRHPNITQFLGLSFLEGSQLPLLVMEKLVMSLDDYLECAPRILLQVKLSILTDICRGLVYLHSYETGPIIHRDLTARNVLLTMSLSAKISDFGNSRMITMKSGTLTQTLSKNPGTRVYMPPEALDDIHKYGNTIDIFSFGVLSLFTLIQEFPEQLLPPTYADHSNPERTLGRSEIARRRVYMDKLNHQFSEICPRLIDLVSRCLQIVSDLRPSSEKLLTMLLSIKNEMEDLPGDGITKVLEMANIVSIRETKILEKKIVNLQNSNDMLERENEDLMEENATISTEKEQLEAEIKLLRLELQSKGKPKGFTFEKRNWQRGSNMPFAMCCYIQCLRIGEKIFVGGGYANIEWNYYLVMEYSIKSDVWNTLPRYIAKNFAMASINDTLALIGGEQKQSVGFVGVWRTGPNKWTFPFPLMPVPCGFSSAICYKSRLVVVGGFMTPFADLTTVQILDLNTKQWFKGPPAPKPINSMKSTRIGNMWYLMGGFTEGVDNSIIDAYSFSLDSLFIERMASASTSDMWKELPSLTTFLSYPFNLDGSLMAVGGEDTKTSKYVSTIQKYSPDRDCWEVVGNLPHEYFTTSCINVDDKIYVMGGSVGSQKLKEVHIYNITQ